MIMLLSRKAMTTAAERVDLDVSLLLLLLLCILICRQINKTFTVQERHSPIYLRILV